MMIYVLFALVVTACMAFGILILNSSKTPEEYGLK